MMEIRNSLDDIKLIDCISGKTCHKFACCSMTNHSTKIYGLTSDWIL